MASTDDAFAKALEWARGREDKSTEKEEGGKSKYSFYIIFAVVFIIFVVWLWYSYSKPKKVEDTRPTLENAEPVPTVKRIKGKDRAVATPKGGSGPSAIPSSRKSE